MGFPPWPQLSCSITKMDPSIGVDIIRDRSLVCRNKPLIREFAFFPPLSHFGNKKKIIHHAIKWTFSKGEPEE